MSNFSVSTVPADDLAPLGVKTSACTVMNKFWPFNSLRLRQNGRYIPDDIFKCIFFNENVQISIKISLKFCSQGFNWW